MCHTAIYRQYTQLMTQSLVEGVIDMLKCSQKYIISDTTVPAMLVEGKQKLDIGKKRINFGAYKVVYVETHNNMKKGAYQQSSESIQ